MASYRSGLTYERLKGIADANAIDRLSSGTVRRNKDKWQGLLSYQVDDSSEPTGKKQVRITHTFTDAKVSGRGATTKPQAMRLVAMWREQVKADALMVAGLAADPTCSVRSCVNQYIDQRENNGKIRHSTATFYRNAAKRIYRYPLASMPMQDLTKPIVQAWVSDLSRTLAGKTVKSSFDLLDAVCKEMVGHDHNPCNGVDLPRITHNAKRKSARPNALSFDGLARCNTMMDEREAKTAGTDYVMLGARIAINTGMRAEEVTGLRWRDVDLRAKVIHVRNIIERAELAKRDDNDNVLYDSKGNPRVTYSEFDSEPKTKNSYRDIPLTPELQTLLTIHKAYVRGLISELIPEGQCGSETVKRPNINDLYVLGGVDGRHMSPHRLGINWGKFARSREILGTEGGHVTFHDLRHTFATRAIANGIDVATVSRLLGHAEISVTLNKYVNSDEQTKRAAIERMADVFAMREKPAAEGVIPFRSGIAG